jgi:hypothetical protein
MSDMAQWLGAKELQSFVAYSLKFYYYADDTKVDHFVFYLAQNIIFHSKLMEKIK